MNEIASYVDRVRAALADLPPAVRDELLEDLPEHLAEVAAEGEGPLADRLGPPEVYAAELRAAAGAPIPSPNLDDRVRDAVRKARARLRVLDARTGPLIGYGATSDFLRLLIPGWWVLRGYLVAMGFAYVFGSGAIGLLPRLDVGEPTVTGWVVLAAFVIGSVWLGRRGTRLNRWPRRVLAVATAVLVLPAIVNVFETDEDARGTPFEQIYYDGELDAVQDIYVYDEQGRPVQNARLFDQDGRLIQPGFLRCDSQDRHDRGVYPLCPEHDPFRRPAPITPTPTPAATPTPTPTPETPTPTPSATG